MFDIGWSELLVIGIVALVVIGPKELPGVVRAVAQNIGKLRRMAAEFQNQFSDAMREMELADLKKDAEKLISDATNLDDVKKTGDEIKQAIEKPAESETPNVMAEDKPKAEDLKGKDSGA